MEKVVHIKYAEKTLFGILHLPESLKMVNAAVLMVVGGPQTRVGAHRSYVQLARFLAERNLAVLRFDYSGIGDSNGPFVGFEHAGPSIRAAIDYLYSEFTDLKSLVIWSLCDGAAASAVYAPGDASRIRGMVLANPFVETEEGQAKTILKHYYKNRLLERDFWKKMLTLNFDVKKSLASFFDIKKQATVRKKDSGDIIDANKPLPERVLDGLAAFAGPMHFLISTKDITGMEFNDHFKNDVRMRKLQKRGLATIDYITDADHTFSNFASKVEAFEKTALAIARICAQPVNETAENEFTVKGG